MTDPLTVEEIAEARDLFKHRGIPSDLGEALFAAAEREVDMLAELVKLDAVVHVLGIEDTFVDPAERVKELRDALAEAKALLTTGIAIAKREARYREALEWYANPDIYKSHPHGVAFDDRDLSFHARAALAQEDDHESVRISTEDAERTSDGHE